MKPLVKNVARILIDGCFVGNAYLIPEPMQRQLVATAAYFRRREAKRYRRRVARRGRNGQRH